VDNIQNAKSSPQENNGEQLVLSATPEQENIMTGQQVIKDYKNEMMNHSNQKMKALLKEPLVTHTFDNIQTSLHFLHTQPNHTSYELIDGHLLEVLVKFQDLRYSIEKNLEENDLDIKILALHAANEKLESVNKQLAE
jgi:hypothetical protein